MPLYFFDITDNDAKSIDDRGVVLPNLAAARSEATRTIVELAADRIPDDGPQHYLAILVRDEHGRVMVRLHLAFDSAGLSADGG